MARTGPAITRRKDRYQLRAASASQPKTFKTYACARDYTPRLRARRCWEGRETMIRFIAVAFGLALATSAQAMPLAPLHQPDRMITEVRFGCGPGRTLVAGRC